jgi:hypothetical protein
LAFAVPLASAAQVDGRPTVVPINFTLTNPCNGELVTFSGDLHIVVTVTQDSAGGFHEGIHFPLSDFKGTGSLGNTYTASGPVNAMSEENSVFAGMANEVATFHVISSGSAPNFNMQALFHFTFNANGEMTSFTDSAGSSCRGG